MPVQFDKYDRQKVDNIKALIDSNAEKGVPNFYEIYVDGLKAVAKTNDPSQFDNFDNYMKEDTNTVKIILYGSGRSPRNEQFVFSRKAKDSQEALDLGLDGLDKKSYTTKELKEMARERAKKNNDTEELEALRKKVAELEATIVEKDSYIAKMQDIIDIATANANKIGGVSIGTVISDFFDDVIRRNKAKIVKIKGLEGLAGFIDDEVPPSKPNEKDGEASFRKKDPAAKVLSEKEKFFLALFEDMGQVFSPVEIDQIIGMLSRMSKDKALLTTVLELIK